MNELDQEKIITEELTEVVMENNIHVQAILKVALDLVIDYQESVFDKLSAQNEMDLAAIFIRRAIDAINEAEKIEGIK